MSTRNIIISTIQAVYTTDSLEWELVQGVSVILPSCTESDMGQTYLDTLSIM